ncbi:MAG: Calx-beta domain-containing protein [Panacagrimonas sp.]
MSSIVRIFSTALLASSLFVHPAQAEEREVGMWDRFEMSVTNDRDYESPYNAVDLDVVYTRPNGSTFEFWGFYDGGSTWKARMMCDAPGRWEYAARFSDGQPGASGSFTCVPSNTPGLLTQDQTNPRWLGFKGGGHVQIRSFHVGDRFFASNWSDGSRREFLSWAKRQGYNMLSIASHLPKWKEDTRGNGWDTPELWPLNAAEYRKMEDILDLLADDGMMVFQFAGVFGKMQDNVPQSPDDQERYVRYLMARIGPYWNLLMSVMGAEMNRHPSANRLGALVQRYNVFDHPLGLHPFDDEFDQISRQPWSSVVVVQGMEAPTGNLPAFLDQMYNGLVNAYVPGKPVYAQETFWPGNMYQPDYSHPEVIRKTGWTTLMSGATLNYGDMDGHSSSGFSGTMNLDHKVQSRHDIMKRIWDFFETVPFYRMNPCRSLVNNGYCLGEPGREYLVYMPRPGSVDVDVTGGRYSVTWINGSDTSDRRNAGTTDDGRDLSTPGGDGGDDWLLHLVRTDGDPTERPEIAFAVADRSVTEGSGPAGIAVRLSRASSSAITASIRVDGSAEPGDDYAAIDQDVTIPAGETEVTLSLRLIDDGQREDAETVILHLDNPSGASLGSPASHTLTVLDDDGEPLVSFEAERSNYAEGEGLVTVGVMLSHATEQTVRVPFAVTGTADADDREIRSDSPLEIPAGETGVQIEVRLIVDQLAEPEGESVIFTLGEPTNAVRGDQTVHALTIDGEAVTGGNAVQLSADAYVVHGSTDEATITLNRIGGSQGAASVRIDTFDGTAEAGSDYAELRQTVIWPEGDDDSKTVNIDIHRRRGDEPDETLNIVLSQPVGTDLGTPATATLTIIGDDDPSPGTVQLSAGSYTVNEASGEAEITVTRRGGGFGEAAVRVVTRNDSAVSGRDYTAVNRVLTWDDGDTASRSIRIPIDDDDQDENQESFRVNLSEVDGADLGGPSSATVRISDDDGGPGGGGGGGPGSDNNPDRFNFQDREGVQSRTDIISNSARISGLGSGGAAILQLSRRSGGDPSYSINGGSFRSGPGTIRNGDQVRIRNRITSASGAASITVTIGGISDTWTITTRR